MVPSASRRMLNCRWFAVVILYSWLSVLSIRVAPATNWAVVGLVTCCSIFWPPRVIWPDPDALISTVMGRPATVSIVGTALGLSMVGFYSAYSSASCSTDLIAGWARL